MKKNIKIISIMMILLCILSISGIVNAFSVDMELNSDSKIKAGEVVEVTLKISSINAGNGIDAIGATLVYDSNIFEEVTQSSFVGINSWNVGIYDTDSKMFTVLRSSKVTSPSDVLKISLRVKDDVTANSSTIEIKEITASGGAVADEGTGDIEITSVKKEIPKATETEQPSTNTVANEVTNEVASEVTNEVTNEIVNEIVNEVIKTNIITKTNVVNNNVNGKLPQTGENDIAIVIGISIVAIIAIVAFIKYRKLDIQ